MNNKDLFYLDIATSVAGKLFDSDINGAPVICEDSLYNYIAPGVLLERIKAMPLDQRAPELRRSSAIITEALEKVEGEGVKLGDLTAAEILEMCAHCLPMIAAEQCSEVYEELASTVHISTKAAQRTKSPQGNADEAGSPTNGHARAAEEALNTDEGRALVAALEKAGFMNNNGQPKRNANKTARAIIAKQLGNLLGVYAWAEAFSSLWKEDKNNYSILCHNYENAHHGTGDTLQVRKILNALADVIAENTELQNDTGKEILKKWGNSKR